MIFLKRTIFDLFPRPKHVLINENIHRLYSISQSFDVHQDFGLQARYIAIVVILQMNQPTKLFFSHLCFGAQIRLSHLQISFQETSPFFQFCAFFLLGRRRLLLRNILETNKHMSPFS